MNTKYHIFSFILFALYQFACKCMSHICVLEGSCLLWNSSPRVGEHMWMGAGVSEFMSYWTKAFIFVSLWLEINIVIHGCGINE